MCIARFACNARKACEKSCLRHCDIARSGSDIAPLPQLRNIQENRLKRGGFLILFLRRFTLFLGSCKYNSLIVVNGHYAVAESLDARYDVDGHRDSAVCLAVCDNFF